MNIPKLKSYVPIQKARILANDFSKAALLAELEEMDQETFNRFCREILYLTEYYDTSIGACVCDIKPIVEEHPDKFSKLPAIDPDRPLNFRILEGD